jgi:hypothetical protein
MFSVCVLLSWGCQNIESVRRDYAQVRFADGINSHEALAVARMRLLRKSSKRAFDIFKSVVVQDIHTSQYPNFWFVSFPPEDQMSPFSYLVVIDRFNGGVIRETEYNHENQVSLNALFE